MSLSRRYIPSRSRHYFFQSVPRYIHNQLRNSSNAFTKPDSVNPSEIAHFNALASTWWDYHGPLRLLHLMNPLRHSFIARCHASQLNGRPLNHKLRYLDVGCGGGIFAESAARLNAVEIVTAIDPSSRVLAVAKAHARRDPGLQGKLFYKNTSIEEMPVPVSVTEQYDVLSLFEVIEHIAFPAAFLEYCKNFVRPGGWVVMSTMARTWLSWLTTIAVAEYALRIVPPGTHKWENYIKPDELKAWFMKEKGWNSPQVSGVVYVPGIGWRQVKGSEHIGNYFFGIRRDN